MPTNAVLNEAAIREKLENFVVMNFLFGDTRRKPEGGASLIETGVMDSTGILELIQFIEEEFGIEVEETETVPQNLDSIAGMVGFIRRKSGGEMP